jgi:hypothetical protein
MHVVPFNAEKHYEAVETWWKRHDWPVIPIKTLPPTGFIIEEVCATWLYELDSNIAMLEWTVANKEINFLKRSQALNTLIDHVLKYAKNQGYEHVFTTANHPGFIGRLKERGFMVTDTSVTHLMARL